MALNVINLVAYTDAAFVPHMATMVRSAVENLDSRTLRLFVIHADVNAELRSQAEQSWSGLQVSVTWIRWQRGEGFVPYAHVSAASYGRLLIGSILPPEIERVLLVDSDTVVLGNLGELWDMDLQDHIVAAALDAPAPIVALSGSELFALEGISPDTPYFNAGVMLVNLRAWREDGIEERLNRLCTDRLGSYRWGDQCLLNAVLHGRWLRLSPAWNQQTYHHSYFAQTQGVFTKKEWVDLMAPKIIHFTGAHKPWDSWCDNPSASAYHLFRARTAFPAFCRRSLNPGRRVHAELSRLMHWFRHFRVRSRHLRRYGVVDKRNLYSFGHAFVYCLRQSPVYTAFVPLFYGLWRIRRLMSHANRQRTASSVANSTARS